MEINEKLNELKKVLITYKKIIVAFSGGIDSSFLIYFASEVLGKDNVIAVTGVSETYTKEEYEFSKDFAKSLGVNQVFVNTTEFDNEDFINNPKDRCYHCKKELYGSVIKIAEDYNIDTIIDGTNYSDKGDYRPGKKAAKEYGVKSPLFDLEITKDEIRNYLKEKGFTFYDKPANPCLASRIPYGEKITSLKLNQIEKGEIFLRNSGFKIVRLRNHGNLAKIEISSKDFHLLNNEDLRDKISGYIKSLGFTWVSVDLSGYRTGSLNEVLSEIKNK